MLGIEDMLKESLKGARAVDKVIDALDDMSDEEILATLCTTIVLVADAIDCSATVFAKEMYHTIKAVEAEMND